MKPYLVTWNRYSNKGKETCFDVILGTTPTDAEVKQTYKNSKLKIDGCEYDALDIEKIIGLLKGVGYKIIEPTTEEMLDKPVLEKHEDIKPDSILQI